MPERIISPDVIEAVNYIPRNYVLTWLRPETNNKIAFGPSYEMKSAIMGVYWPKLAKRIDGWKAYKEAHKEYVVLGRHTPALFKPPEEAMQAEDLAALFREKVRQKEGTYITDLTPGKVFEEIGVRGNVFYGRVKSKSGRGVYDVNYRSAFLTPDEKPDIFETTCTCKEHTETMGKGHGYVIFVFDVHPTRLNREIVGERLNPNRRRRHITVKTDYGREKGDNPFYRMPSFFHPFMFVANWRGRDGILTPKSEDLEMLELDMAMECYFNGATYDQINRKVFRLPEIYAQPLRNAAGDGECQFELLRHGSEKREEKDRQLAEAEKFLLRQIYAAIIDTGYTYDSLCLELGRPAIRFESEKNVLNFVPGRVKGQYRPPFYVVRPNTGKKMRLEEMCSAYDDSINPFRNLNIDKKPLEIVDDAVKHKTPAVIRSATTLIVPELENKPVEIKLPTHFEQVYRRVIERFSPDADRDLRKARLFYQRKH